MTETADTERLVKYVVTSLVAFPDEVVVERKDQEGTIVYEVTVNQADVGKVIGRQGRMIKALRMLARAAASTDEQQVDVEVLG